MIDSRRRRLRDRSSGPVTLINEGCRITGNLAGNGDFLVSGAIEGDCDSAGTVTLARSGSWKGTIRARHVIVSGCVDGDIVASGHVEITDTARITGTVTGEAIAVSEGAVVEGTMKTTVQAGPTEFTEKRTEPE